MRIPKYRKHSLRNFGFVEFKGKRISFPGVYNSQESIAAYKAFLAQNLGVVALGKPAAKPGCSLTQLVRDYLLHLRSQTNEDQDKLRGTYSNAKIALKRFIAHAGTIAAASVGPRLLKDWQAAMAVSGLARSYVNCNVSHVKSAYRWATSEEIVAAEVWHALESVKALGKGKSQAKEAKKRQPVAWDTIEPLLPHLTPPVRAMVLLQHYTGARSGSVVRACPNQFERDGDFLLWRPEHKTEGSKEEDLVLPLGPLAQAAIAEFLNGPPDEPIFSPRSISKHPRFRKRYSSGSYRECVQDALKRLNAEREKQKLEPLPRWTPHQQRHSKGHLVRRKYGIEAAQATLGHDSLNSTEIYSARQLELAKQVARETG